MSDALLKNNVAVAVQIAHATAWWELRKVSSARRSSDLRPSKGSEEMTDEEAKLATGGSTDGSYNSASSSGAEQYSFLSRLLGEVKDPG